MTNEFFGWITNHKGGPESGNHDHAGIPGHLGGSAPSKGGGKHVHPKSPISKPKKADGTTVGGATMGSYNTRPAPKLSVLRGKLKKLGSDEYERNRLVSNYINEEGFESDGEYTKYQGMGEREMLRSITIEGIKYLYPDTDDGLEAVSRTIDEIMSSNLVPISVSRCTKRIVITSQTNKEDAIVSKKLGVTFKSAASGGSATIVIYENGKLAEDKAGTVWHEMAHNFAGVGMGKREDWYFNFTAVALDGKEKPISDYAKTDGDEDFAETFMYYMSSKSDVKYRCPKRYAILKKVLEDKK